MVTQNTTQATGEKKYINLATKKRGFLACDANYFDRTCKTCGGMYTSFTTSACPKCGAALTFFAIGNGKAMAILECTMYPMIRKSDEDQIKKRIQEDIATPPVTYRFKMFSFSENGVLSPPPEFSRLKKGAMVEFLCINTIERFRLYNSKELNRTCVEVMHLIYKDRGSSVRVISDPKAKAEAAIAYQVDAAGNPVPMPPPFPQQAQNNDLKGAIAEMEKNIAALKAQLASMPGAPVQGTVAQQAAVDDADDPFGMDSHVIVDDDDAPF